MIPPPPLWVFIYVLYQKTQEFLGFFLFVFRIKFIIFVKKKYMEPEKDIFDEWAEERIVDY